MTPTEYKDKLQDVVTSVFMTAPELREWAFERRQDAAKLRTLYGQVEDMQTDSDLLQAALLGTVEDMRCDLIDAAQRAEGRAADIEEEEADDLIYGTYDEQVRFDYNAGVCSL